MPDGTTEFLDVNSLDHMESEYGLWVTDSGDESERIEVAKQMGQAMIQNGLPTSAVLELYDSQSFTQIKEKIKKAEVQQQELEQAQQKAQEEQAQAQLEQEQVKMENEHAENDKDRQNRIDVAKISAGVGMEKNKIDQDLRSRELDIKEEEVSVKEQDNSEKARSNRAKEQNDKTKISEDSKNEDKKLKAAKKKESNKE